jgi:hypothetical protein
MHKTILVLLILVVMWFLINKGQPDSKPMLQGVEPYKNKKSEIQFPNAEFKFYT